LRVDDFVDALDEKVAGLGVVGVIGFDGRWSGVGVGGVLAGWDDECGGNFAVFFTVEVGKREKSVRGIGDVWYFFFSFLESLMNEGIGGI
jgi:hypothetical protein